MSLTISLGHFSFFILICTYFDPPLNKFPLLECSGVVNGYLLALFAEIPRITKEKGLEIGPGCPSTANKLWLILMPLCS